MKLIINVFMFLLVGAFALLLSSCSSVVNPYKSEFECPPPSKGKCIGIPEAYKESLQDAKIPQSQKETKKEDSQIQEGSKQSQAVLRNDLLLSPAESEYIENLYNVLTKLLKDPQTPIITPPKIIRVLILPYQSQDGKLFYSARYVYIVADEPKWVLQNLLRAYPSAEE